MKSVSLLQNNNSKWFALIILVVITAIGLGLINKLSKSESERDSQNWQYRLSLMADVREELLNNWMSAQFGTLSSLAKNQSLRLYLSEVSKSQTNSLSDIQTAQRTYLQNLLLQTAIKNGFYEKSAISPIKANITQVKHSGIAIVSTEGKVIAATPGMPVLDKLSIEKIKQVASNRNKQLHDIYLDDHNEQVIAFIVPAPIITNANITNPTKASIIGIRTVGNSLYPLLDKEIFSTKTDDSILVRRHQSSVIYLNKKNNNYEGIFLKLPRDSKKLAAAYALSNPGAFSIKRNYSGKEVLFISREVKDTNWLLLQTISSTEALAASEARRQSLIISFLLGLAALIFILIASWRHGASLYAQKYAAALQEKSAILTQQKNVLQTVTNNIGDLILIIDDQLHIQFSNLPVASIYGLTPEDLVGKTLTASFGHETGKVIENYILDSHNNNRTVITVNKLSFNNTRNTYHCSFFPINEYNTLIVLHDITELRNAVDKHKRLMKHLVQTLTHVIDSYVPDSANHSAKTTKLAHAIAQELNLSNTDIETLELAACLANIGKLFIPREILEKTTELTDEERETLQTTINQTSNILIDLEFDGPVLETIAQKSEHIDGSGYPGGISGEQILMTARILAVANAFVAMQSPRAYRKPLSTKDILDQLYKESGTLYDKRVIAALMHVSENRKD